MLRTIAVVALKGGSGKTTIATHLALAAHLRGLDTFVVDTDPQRSTSEVLAARVGPGPQWIQSSGAELLSATIAAAGLQKQLLIIDTAAGALEDASEAIVLADFVVMVVRPTLLDLHALARTMTLVRRLRRPSTVVVNQAPPARGGVESPLVSRAIKALVYMRASVAPTIVRSRTIYQTALETGRSAEEMSDPAAAKDIAALWEYIDLRAEVDLDEGEDLSALESPLSSGGGEG
ncbi:MAG TPA: ParA family protein [Caulobacteraceae bacterium]|jgi:chromosome partitioning protein|nr:ParA family protein [Caulobacteraceae bacterium]